MYRVSYIENTNTISHKSGFETEKMAMEWIEKNNIKALKLLVWDNKIDCYSTIKTFNNNRKNATSTMILKTLYI